MEFLYPERKDVMILLKYPVKEILVVTNWCSGMERSVFLANVVVELRKREFDIHIGIWTW